MVEVKVSKGKTLPRTALKEHQRRALELASGSGMYFKIPDGGFTLSPFDGLVAKRSASFLVIWYEVKPKHEVWAIAIKDVPVDVSISIDYARSVGLRVDC
jgi:hypothetical protein